VKDVSFALQALGIEQLVVDRAALGPGVHAVSPAVDREVGRLKLAALAVQIDEPTEEQTEYLSPWSAVGPSPS
jgi:adenosylhomocysteinase